MTLLSESQGESFRGAELLGDRSHWLEPRGSGLSFWEYGLNRKLNDSRPSMSH